MSKAYLLLILHAHMPYVLDKSADDSMEERWLYEAMAECYLRLIQVFDRLISDKVPFCLTLSLSPTLIAQLEDREVSDRFVAYLERQIGLSRSEIHRTRGMNEYAQISKMYKAYYEQVLDTFEKRCKRDILGAFRSYQETGVLEVITCPATHAYLPLLRPDATGINAQISLAGKEYKRIFGASLAGLWLPECGYFPGLDGVLKDKGIGFTFIDTHTFLRSNPVPMYGTYAPVMCPSGLVMFGRDDLTAKQVWSAKDGYPGDSDYRDFYRDIGYDIELDYLMPYLPGGARCYTGLKYHRIEDDGGEKGVYAPDRILHKASVHADDFLTHRLKEIRELSQSMDSPPVICAYYDAELFGHWWFEGPAWIEMLFRKMQACDRYLNLITPSKYLQLYPKHQVSQPPGGSWGWKGSHESWIDKTNAWVYPHLFKAGEKVEMLACKEIKGQLQERALNQACRELLLAQSSDWGFMLHNELCSGYATRRIKGHIGRFWRIIKQIEGGCIDPHWLGIAEKEFSLFPGLSYKEFCK